MGMRTTIRVTVRLDVEHDADLITWLQGLAPGSRSALIRAAWRAGLGETHPREAIDAEALRRVVAEEMSKVLAKGQLPPLRSSGPTEEIEVNAVEAEFGAKLDRMLGSLGKSKPKGEIDG